MKWTIYRGEFEPVTKIHKSEVIFHPSHIEVVYDYEYIMPDGQFDRVKWASILSKNSITSIEIGETYSELDPNEELVSTVYIKTAASKEQLRCKSQKESESLYLKLREFYLS